MSRRVYISCELEERELDEVKSLCHFLQKEDCLLEFVPDSPDAFYRGIESAIERADAFVAVVGCGYDSATWLNHELHYASTVTACRLVRAYLGYASVSGICRAVPSRLNANDSVTLIGTCCSPICTVVPEVSSLGRRKSREIGARLLRRS